MRRRQGLTLVELLIAAGLAGALGLVIALGVQAGLRVATALASSSHAENALRLLAVLEQDVASALPDCEQGFEGTATSLALSRRIVNGPEGIPAVARIQWTFEPATRSARRQVRFDPPHLDPDPASAAAPPAETFSAAQAVRFAYLPGDATDADAAQDHWPPPVRLPTDSALPAAVLADVDGHARLLPAFASSAKPPEPPPPAPVP